MKVLVDKHHPDLLESFMLTMEDRLGWEVYVMAGMEWFNEEIWQHEAFWAGDRFAQLFLPLPDDARDTGTYYTAPDHRHSSASRILKMLTLPQARDLVRGDEWIVIATVPGNQIGFHRFAVEQGTKYGVQIGNNEHPILWNLEPLTLNSTEKFVPDGIAHVKYDQEMDMRLFYQSPVPVDGPVSSFVNVWKNGGGTFDLFSYVKSQVPEREFLVYGDRGTELVTSESVASEQHRASAFWHTKELGDGWGYVIHQSASIGRPLIGTASYYRGLRAEWLWDRSSSLDLSGRRFEDSAREVRRLLGDPERMEQMGASARRLFDSHVHYDRDAENIRHLIEEGRVAR